MMKLTLPERSTVNAADTWDMTSIYPDDTAWQAEVDAIAAELPELLQFTGRLSESSAVLAEWFERSEALELRLGKVLMYASGYRNVDNSDQAAAARYDTALTLEAQVVTALSFAEPELLTLGFETLRRWLGQEPRLAHYKHYLDKLELQASHIRSAEVEEVLGMASAPLGSARDTHSILTDADLAFRPALDADGAEHTVAQGTIDALLMSPDRTLRKSAWESYADGALAFRNTLANCLATGVKQDVFSARVRRYDSSLQAALSETSIPEAVYRSAIETFRRNIPVWHRYWRLRQRAQGEPKLAVYDIAAPLADSPAIPFRQALDWVCAGLAPLGDEYVRTVRRGVLEQRWVDIYPNQHKSSGAFSSGRMGTHPFILLNYTEDVEGLSTLAHELGHSMHSYLTWQKQPFIYSDYGIFVAEVASNLHQALVRDYVMRTQPVHELQIALCLEAMSNLHRYLFLMPTLARFELEIHERAERGEALTAERLTELLAGLFAEGYGGLLDEDDERQGITWAHFPHHLYANFYVYQYSTGIAAAQVLSKGILAGKPGAVERYLEFLSAGDSLYPLDALKLAGVDMSQPEPMDAAYRYLESVIARLEELLD
ncbi:MAG: oligoendopeptidase F [Chloroflexi bacterium]|nr:oligoendopeptidase F [Chloroflexota bacterium]